MSDIRDEDYEVETVLQDEDAETETEPEPTGTDYIEFVGQAPLTAEFVGERSITRKQVKDAWGVSMPKDLVWTKAPAGRNRGRMLVSTEGMDQELLERLEAEPGFKRVTLSE